MRVAFYGRVSTEDAQDPSLSIPRQLGKCNQVLEPIGEKVGVSFWDVESGRKALEERGNGKRDWSELVDVPRAGGLPELLASAKAGEIDAVIVESIDRLSRMTADGTRIERELEERDIALFAADEPLNSSATAILTRRVKQGVAEWYVRDLIERSRAGMEESVRQGWHTGGPAPYGYALEPHPHPNPQKAREGRKKHRLVIDPLRAPIVLMIFTWYVEDEMGLGTICEKLNSDLDRYPPPKRNRKDENDLPQTWSKSQLHSLLRNPKYTGYNVWGRHDKRQGRPVMRPREQWVWSATPTHEAIVPRELFDAVEERARRNSGPTHDAKPKHYPQRRSGKAGRLYVLRGRVRCGICGRRMEGSHQKGSNWYRCQYVSRRGLAAADTAGHPRVLGIKEDVVLDALREFMAERLFGPERLRLLTDELAASAAHAVGYARRGARATARRAEEDRAGALSPGASTRGARRPRPSCRQAREAADRGAERPGRGDRAGACRPRQSAPGGPEPRGDRGDAGRRPRPPRGPGEGRRRGAGRAVRRLRRCRQLRQTGAHAGAERLADRRLHRRPRSTATA